MALPEDASSRAISAIILGGDGSVIYDNGKGGTDKVDGKLISLDDNGFVVVELDNGDKVLIPKEGVKRIDATAVRRAIDSAYGNRDQ